MHLRTVPDAACESPSGFPDGRVPRWRLVELAAGKTGTEDSARWCPGNLFVLSIWTQRTGLSTLLILAGGFSDPPSWVPGRLNASPGGYRGMCLHTLRYAHVNGAQKANVSTALPQSGTARAGNPADRRKRGRHRQGECLIDTGHGNGNVAMEGRLRGVTN